VILRALRRLVATQDLAAAALLAVVTFSPFVRGALTGQTFYFRDFSTSYLPLRLFALEGLRHGELRYWNPYAHEGVPMPYPPLSYPLELPGVLSPTAQTFSLMLALHVPLAAIAFLVLARGLGLARPAAVGGAIVYALGGFSLSSLNLYFYLEAMAWAPLVLLSLWRASQGSRSAMVAGAATTAMTIATLGAEIAIQTLLIAAVLCLGRGRSPLRFGISAALGVGLAAPTVLVMRGIVAASARQAGFHPAVVLAQSVHPFTLLQVVIGGLYGDLTDLTNRWWGQNFFPRGFPYILSLYLGATALALAWVGARRGGGFARRLSLLALAALVICLGRWAGLEPLVELLPARPFRYPTKAFFTVHLAAALLAVLGLDALVRGERAAWRQLAAAAFVLGAIVVVGPRAFAALTGPAQRFQSAFFPPGTAWPQRLESFRFMVDDATRGGLIALVAGGVVLLHLAGRIRPAIACHALVGLLAADLLRTGAGLNPMVTASFFRLSEEMTREADVLRARGRTFTCDIQGSPAYWQARAARATNHEVWTFAVLMETLTPNLNTPQRVRTAFSEDLTSLVPAEAAPPIDTRCSDFGAIAERLREGAVSDVISLDPLTDPRLRRRRFVTPVRIAPLAVGIYELSDPLPLRSVAGSARSGGGQGRVLEVSESSDRVDLVVEADGPATLLMRETWMKGWSARVNGAPAPVSRAEGRYRSVEIPAGRSRVELRYDPPGLRAGLVISLLSVGALMAIGLRRPQPPPARRIAREAGTSAPASIRDAGS
jgi:hypothetical protein